MTFHSILSEKDGDDDGAKEGTPGVPDFFVDLNLDQIVDAITADKEEYDLRPFFNASLKSVDAIKYRQDVMRDLEDAGVHDAIGSFAQRMRAMRQYLDRANRLTYKYNSQGWFLSSVEAYCDAVAGLASGLAGRPLRSRGLAAFFEYLKGYAASAPFMSLAAETKKLRADLSAAKYALVIEHDLFTVRKYEGETDYGEEMERVFEKFRHGTAKDYRVAFTDGPGVNHIQAAALDLVARLYPETFQSLEDYCVKHRIFLDKTVTRFDREVQFYAAYLELVAKLKSAGLHFCYPAVSDESKEISSLAGFDLALAVKLTRENSPVVCNDLFLKGTERIFVVNGPEPGRQDHLRPRLRTAALPGEPRVSCPREGGAALPVRQALHALCEGRGSRQLQEQAGRRPGQDPLHPRPMHVQKHSRSERGVQLQHGTRCHLPGEDDTRADSTAGRALRLRDVRR